jgi:hypothetical protein
VQNAVVIETEELGQAMEIEDADIEGIVGGHRSTLSFSNENNADSVLTRIAAGIRVGMELTNYLNIKTGFFLCFPASGTFNAFAIVNKAAGQGPPMGRIAAFDQNNGLLGAIAQGDDDVNRWGWIAVGHSSSSYRMVWEVAL